MTKPFRIGIFQMPSARGSVWRQAIQAASAGQDWFVTKLSESELDPNDERNLVILLRDGAQALSMAPTLDACVILDEPLDAICDAMIGLYTDNPQKAYAVAAERLAAAAVWKRAGATVIQVAALSGDFPIIGSISRQPDGPADPAVPTLDPAPLGMYRTGAPEAGCTTTWPWDLFSFKTTERSELVPPKIDMTGRARVLFHGPRFQLPPGEWRIRVRFSLDTEDRLSSLRVEWGLTDDFETLEINLDESGSYEIELTKRWDKAGPVELRVWAATGHFVGSMIVGDTEVTLLNI